jgi:hypothetical protein
MSLIEYYSKDDKLLLHYFTNTKTTFPKIKIELKHQKQAYRLLMQ